MERPKHSEPVPKGYIFVPEVSLYVSPHVSEGDVSALDSYKKAPTLAQLRKISAFVRANKLPFTSERGEWTADFVNFDIESGEEIPEGHVHALYIAKPALVKREKGQWVALGGKETRVILPPNGWIIPDTQGNLYHEETGVPFRTTNTMEDASSSDYAYFWRGEKGDGLLAVNRECERVGSNSFEVSIMQTPDFSHENIGVREIRSV